MLRMPEYTFIHAADLHLGAPFRGLDAVSRSGRAVSGTLMTEASYTALQRLEALCLETDAAFLILAGDLYDSQDGVLRARFALRDMCARLAEHGVRVFIAHGNHDPLGGANPLPFPANVTIFGGTPETFCVTRGGKPVALVQGVSHTTPNEKKNLARQFSRFEPGMPVTVVAAEPDNTPAQLPQADASPAIPTDIPHIAVLHCAVGGAGANHAPYAPCTLGDLTGTHVDYWALGHIHQGGILAEAPPVVYAGAMQGLHINESGPHGCYAVRVNAAGDCTPRFVPLAPVQWEKTELDLDTLANAPESLDDLTDALLATLAEHPALRPAEHAPAPGETHTPSALIFRLTLRGHTPLDKDLRKPGALETYLDRLREEVQASSLDAVAVLVKDIVLQTAPVMDFNALALRDDLVGEIVRLTDETCADPEHAASVAEKALAPLYGHRRLKKILTPLDATELAHTAASARSLLCSILEDD